MTQTTSSEKAREKARGRHVQYATFRLGNELYGVDVLEVREIMKPQEMTPIPLAPDYVYGLLNLRGQIITAIDLGRRITGGLYCAGARSMNVVVASDDEVASLLVDSVGDVLEIPQELEEPPPTTLHSIKPEYLRGVCKMDKQTLLILNLDTVLDAGRGLGREEQSITEKTNG